MRNIRNREDKNVEVLTLISVSPTMSNIYHWKISAVTNPRPPSDSQILWFPGHSCFNQFVLQSCMARCEPLPALTKRCQKDQPWEGTLQLHKWSRNDWAHSAFRSSSSKVQEGHGSKRALQSTELVSLWTVGFMEVRWRRFSIPQPKPAHKAKTAATLVYNYCCWFSTLQTDHRWIVTQMINNKHLDCSGEWMLLSEAQRLSSLLLWRKVRYNKTDPAKTFLWAAWISCIGFPPTLTSAFTNTCSYQTKKAQKHINVLYLFQRSIFRVARRKKKI